MCESWSNESPEAAGTFGGSIGGIGNHSVGMQHG
jgi:hypothetical protein